MRLIATRWMWTTRDCWSRSTSRSTLKRSFSSTFFKCLNSMSKNDEKWNYVIYHANLFSCMIKINLKLIELKNRNAFDRNTTNVSDAKLLITFNVKIDHETKFFVDILQVFKLYEQKWWKMKLYHLSCKFVFKRKNFKKKFDLYRFRTSNDIDQITIFEFVLNDDLNQMHQWKFR